MMIWAERARVHACRMTRFARSQGRTTLHMNTSMGLMFESFRSALPLPVVYPARPSARRSSSSLAACAAASTPPFSTSVTPALLCYDVLHTQACRQGGSRCCALSNECARPSALPADSLLRPACGQPASTRGQQPQARLRDVYLVAQDEEGHGGERVVAQ